MPQYRCTAVGTGADGDTGELVQDTNEHMAAMAEKGWRLISTNRSNAVLLLFWEFP